MEKLSIYTGLKTLIAASILLTSAAAFAGHDSHPLLRNRYLNDDSQIYDQNMNEEDAAYNVPGNLPESISATGEKTDAEAADRPITAQPMEQDKLYQYHPKTGHDHLPSRLFNNIP